MNKELIPENLQHLIPLVEKWGIEDDGYRDHLVYNSTSEQLQSLVNCISDEDADNLNFWFIKPQLVKSPTNEYLKFSAFFMAYEYAEAVLKSRTKKS
jgi:hypothetical protein